MRAPFPIVSGREPGVVFHNKTERNRAELERDTVHQGWFKILESIADGFFALDQDWRFTYVNARAEAAWGKKRDELLGKNIWRELPAMVATDMFVQLRRSVDRNRRVEFITESLHRRQLVEVESFPCDAGVCVYFRDVGRRSRAERLHLAALEQVTHAQEKERRRIARELHDSVGQKLLVFILKLKCIMDARTLRECKKHARELRTVNSQIFDDITRIARGLYATNSEKTELPGSLRHLAHEFSAAYRTRVVVDADDLNAIELPGSTQIALYRIIQEALANVAKHSKATKININVNVSSGRLVMKVVDDGRGFSVHKLKKNTLTQLGLRTMRERAEMLGGKFLISSAVGRGTRLQVDIPITSPRVRRRENKTAMMNETVK